LGTPVGAGEDEGGTIGEAGTTGEGLILGVVGTELEAMAGGVTGRRDGFGAGDVGVDCNGLGARFGFAGEETGPSDTGGGEPCGRLNSLTKSSMFD